jgi:hypothetical protein
MAASLLQSSSAQLWKACRWNLGRLAFALHHIGEIQVGADCVGGSTGADKLRMEAHQSGENVDVLLAVQDPICSGDIFFIVAVDRIDVGFRLLLGQRLIGVSLPANHLVIEKYGNEKS